MLRRTNTFPSSPRVSLLLLRGGLGFGLELLDADAPSGEIVPSGIPQRSGTMGDPVEVVEDSTSAVDGEFAEEKARGRCVFVVGI